MTRFHPTAEMTVGPFFPREFGQGANDLTMLGGKPARGRRIEIAGRVVQLDGSPLDNLVIELWQADAQGVYRDAADPRFAEADPDFLGWGRAATDRDGRYAFRTILPGAREGRAPHVNLLLLFSGLMHQLQTVMYFDEAPADPVYLSVPPARRPLLVAKADGPDRFRFDIRLRADGETPFFGD